MAITNYPLFISLIEQQGALSGVKGHLGRTSADSDDELDKRRRERELEKLRESKPPSRKR